MWKIFIGVGIYTNINVSVWRSTGEPHGEEDGSKKDAWKNPKPQYQHEENNNIKVLEAGEMQYWDLLWPLVFCGWVCLHVLVANTGSRIWSFISAMPKATGISAFLWSSAGGWMSLLKQWGLREEISAELMKRLKFDHSC